MMPLGVRWNPLPGDHRSAVLRPFITGGLGPVIGTAEGSFVGRGVIVNGSTTRGTLGAFVGGGLDLHVARSFTLGMSAVYNGMADFSEPVGLRDNFNGVQIVLGIGWLWGRGAAAP
jgi:hypothetical protein